MVHRAGLLIRRFEDAPQARPFAGLSLFGLPAMVDSTLDRTTMDVEKAAKLCVKKGPVCTKNPVRIDLVTESLNVSGDGHAVMLLPDPVRLAVQVEEPT